MKGSTHMQSMSSITSKEMFNDNQSLINGPKRSTTKDDNFEAAANNRKRVLAEWVDRRLAAA